MIVDMLEARTLPLTNLPDLATGQSHLWIARLDHLPVMEPGVPDAVRDRQRRRRMGQRFLLRLLLGAYLGIPGRDVLIERRGAGKPTLSADLTSDGRGLGFNLSHAEDWLAIAIARGVEVGVDIECRDRTVRWRALARRWFDAGEVARLEALPENDARIEFLRRWSAREALIKAQGETLGRSIGSVVPGMDDPGLPSRLPATWPEPDRWDVREITGAPGLVGFLAAPAAMSEVRGLSLALGP